MRLLLTTSRSVLLWDGELHALHEGWGAYYGLTWDHDTVYVACRGHPDGEAVVAFGEGFCPGEWLPLGDLKALHQIMWRDGKLYVCNTGRNRLEIWDGIDGKTFDYSGLGGRRDKDHINSVWLDGRALYVAEHRFAEGSRIRKFDENLELVRTFASVGREIHNVYREAGTLYTCHSPWHCLRAVNVNGKQKDIPLANWGYTRGLARAEGQWFVGLSREAPRGKRHDGLDSAVLVLDDGLERLETIQLEGVGQLLEVRALEGDLAHNGLPCPIEILNRGAAMTLEEAVGLLADEFDLDAGKMRTYAEQDDLGGEYIGWSGGSVPDVDGRLLYALVRAAKVETALEFGTGHGCATSHVARALRDNGRGVIVTLDKPDSIDLGSYRVPEAYESHIVRVIEDGLAWIRRNRWLYFDLVFEDGPHTYEFTKEVIEASLPWLNPGGFIVVHDVYGPHEDQVWPGLRAALPDVGRILVDGSICGLGYWRKPVDENFYCVCK